MQRSRGFLALLGALILGMGVARGQTAPFQPLVETSAQRLQIAKKVALAKWDSGAAVEDAPREAQVVQKAVKDGEAKGLDSAQVEAFFRAQIEANKVIQYSLLADWQRAGKAPAHPPVDLVKEIRPQLDEIEEQLITELAESATARASKTCHADIAKAVGEYITAHKWKPDSRDAVALDRAVAATCAK